MNDARRSKSELWAIPPLGRTLAAVALGAGVGVAISWSHRRPPPAPPSPTVRSVASSAPTIATTGGRSAPTQVAPPPPPRGYGIEPEDRARTDAPQAFDEDYLVSLVPMLHRDERSLALAHEIIGPYVSHVNQGNFAIAQHRISRAQCLRGLADVVLQTEEQRAICGHPYEVPIHTGDAAAATVCIDEFEYPNRPCVLPFVHSFEIVAERLCALDGKRLCSDEEWNTACEADPRGGRPTAYAYGDALDLAICTTGKPYQEVGTPTCDPDSPSSMWPTCATNTEPTGSHPRCRSRLGVFDQHGNVAEAMTRKDKRDGVVYSQLKGSAFFYDGVMYPDTCRYDPRWHVEVAADSWHSNYHLGFRCCRDVVPLSRRGGAHGVAQP
jgi:sulfatase modifying factor 1